MFIKTIRHGLWKAIHSLGGMDFRHLVCLDLILFSSYFIQAMYKQYLCDICAQLLATSVEDKTYPILSNNLKKEKMTNGLMESLVFTEPLMVQVRHKLFFHCFALDLQIYLPMKPTGTSAQKSLFDCLANIKQWLAENFLSMIKNRVYLWGCCCLALVPWVQSSNHC